MTLKSKNINRPKRLLSLDGGGIRGIISAEILLKIEKIICERTDGNCLADYFDLIGGTSTGAIIAAALAKGMKVQEILNLYTNYGRQIFTKNWWVGQLWSRYNPKPLEDKLQEIFGDIVLGSDELKTFLMIVSKNVTTDRTWFFVNNPKNKYFPTSSQIPLWHIVRASSAAPTFFPPHEFDVGKGQRYEFVDGGVSVFNNPSFRVFLEATYEDYGIGWETGKDNILLISVGTGFSDDPIPLSQARKYTLANWGIYAVETLMEDANVQQNMLLKLISKMPQSEPLNSELSLAAMPQFKDSHELSLGRAKSETDLIDNFAQPPLELLTYHRYTTCFTKERFERLGLKNINPKSVASMDCVDQIDVLCRIGKAVAEKQVSETDFEGFLHPDNVES